MSTPADCPRCGARMRVETSRRAGDLQLQYLACKSCRGRGRRAVPASTVWRNERKRK